jgi:hypothetical protein
MLPGEIKRYQEAQKLKNHGRSLKTNGAVEASWMG